MKQSCVSQPNPQDVLQGKDKSSYHHPGNTAFRQLVQEHAAYYAEAHSRNARTQVAQDLCDLMTKNEARFLKPMGNGGWSILSDDLARSKMAHALRDAVAHANGVKKTISFPLLPTTTTASVMLKKAKKKRRYLKVHESYAGILKKSASSTMLANVVTPPRRVSETNTIKMEDLLASSCPESLSLVCSSNISSFNDDRFDDADPSEDDHTIVQSAKDLFEPVPLSALLLQQPVHHIPVEEAVSKEAGGEPLLSSQGLTDLLVEWLSEAAEHADSLLGHADSLLVPV
jgi:hypothetical protein